ncbi:MAG: glycosyltransferase family 4 protein [Bacteroidales bacterium]|nr:glycosyltransferase family 4 protein [Bacteroidales bacterium]
MKVLFDYQAFEMQSHGGVSRSFAELCSRMPEHGISYEVGIQESDNIYLREKHLCDFIRPLNYTHDRVFGKRQLFKGQWWLEHHILSSFGGQNDFRDVNQKFSVELLKRRDFDVFHPSFFDKYFLPYLDDKPFVLTIHDMIPELYPQYFAREDTQIVGKQILSPKASAIIAVSEKTKEDVVRILHVPEEKVHVIYHGCSFNIPAKAERIFQFPYLLYVGERAGYKNFVKLIDGAVPSLLKHDDLKLVCTGKPFTEVELKLFESLGIRDKVIHHWVADDDEFYSLYHFAECFVYPSDYEGFGIPILEAYTADCPVLLNNASCFPEIAGDAAVYFSFEHSGDLNEKLEYMLSMSLEQREILIQKQRERLSLYSWEKSAGRLAEVYKSVV